ncbi:hypothetical protein D3C87_985790 [compost metagenome]
MIGKTVEVVPGMIPAQLSMAVGIDGETEHSAVISLSAGTPGAVASLIITF